MAEYKNPDFGRLIERPNRMMVFPTRDEANPGAAEQGGGMFDALKEIAGSAILEGPGEAALAKVKI